ncbi:MAG: glycosyltransferase, partial [Caulobacteraceae bacterium]|nr:glycosyltransferase [Caulobacter sp.]
MLFVISEDWFFASHFLGLAEAVRDAGFAVSVHCRINDPALQARFERSGLRVLPSSYDRGAAGRRGDLAQIARFHRLFRRERPDVVHVISLRMVLIAGVAARLARVPVRVH